MRRTRIFLLVAALGLAAAACGEGVQESAPPTAPETAPPTTDAPSDATAGTAADGAFVPDPIEFDECGDGFECGALTVPLDYDDPSGPTIDVAVLRIPAADPDERIGVLLTNPGGPGASGIDFAAAK